MPHYTRPVSIMSTDKRDVIGAVSLAQQIMQFCSHRNKFIQLNYYHVQRRIRATFVIEVGLEDVYVLNHRDPRYNEYMNIHQSSSRLVEG